ncbi:uncharacterized protein LOC125244503 [Megalobrama amblycephala]|uniref:uncharacterized protein LOC125244503 n=1 Tax=Megalobrama amblycephala TaxID=75352 RepID=UPI0020144DCF|nr:uncharacterized protein LOC125244503 [Megalobrama amblycephala]
MGIPAERSSIAGSLSWDAGCWSPSREAGLLVDQHKCVYWFCLPTFPACLSPWSLINLSIQFRCVLLLISLVLVVCHVIIYPVFSPILCSSSFEIVFGCLFLVYSSVFNIDHNLTIVLFGSSAAVQFRYDNVLLGDIGNVKKSWFVPLHKKISGHHVSVINMIGLHETALDLDQLTGQLVNENEIIAFIFVVRSSQLTDADKMGIDWLRRVFGDRVLQFVLILFTYESEEESDSIIDDLKKNSALEHLLKECGGRYHTCSKDMNKQSEMRDLMKRIERLLIDNEQRRYTSEMYNTAIREREDLQRTCQSKKRIFGFLMYLMFIYC